MASPTAATLAALALLIGLSAASPPSFPDDWLTTKITTPSVVHETICWPEYGPDVCGMEIANGLISRRFVLQPAFGTIDWLRNTTAARGGLESMFRAVSPEASVNISGVTYQVGGLVDTSTFRAYFNRTGFQNRLAMASNKSTTFSYVSHRVAAPTAPFPWTPGSRHSIAELEWPPKGVTLAVEFALAGDAVALEAGAAGLRVTLFYEVYDGLPLMSKWMTITAANQSSGDGGNGDGKGGRDSDDGGSNDNNDNNDNDVIVEATTVEIFAAMPRFGAYTTHGSLAPGSDGEGAVASSAPPPLLHAKTDQAHGAACAFSDDYAASADPIPGCPTCKDQGATEPLLRCTYSSGPGAHVNGAESFISFRALLLATDSPDLERQTLSRHRVTQLLAPHTTENPIFFHATDVSSSGFKNAIDQMADAGFEMLIFSFGSGFQLETNDTAYLAKIKGQVEYARNKGIEVGGYDLICLDRGHGGYGGNVGDEWVTVAPDGTLKEDACFASGWYDKLHSLIDNFINETGLSMLETDGPYGGGACAATNHSHHHGLEDSVYRQTQLQSQFYREMRRLGVYVNQPDNFFFQGGSRTGMGYDENQYSLPRWHDLSISRMGMYDDLYTYLPTQGWMFLPIGDYHAGGAAATFQGHDVAFEWGLAQYLGAGTAACYRGAELWNASTAAGQRIRSQVKKWTGFFKRHRQTLIQPVVHLRRPDMQSWDGWLHVNPFAYGSGGGGGGNDDDDDDDDDDNDNSEEVGAAMLFNPTKRAIELQLSLPLYYTGLDTAAMISVDEAPAVKMTLGRDYSVLLSLSMPPETIHTVVVSRP
eukprot:g2305.t1